MINGVINIYKEKGYTSHDVVAKLRGILKQKKIGHTGTLDPDATGVLPVCLGKGTKLCDILLDKDKTYKAVLIFGISTDTEDISGKVIESMDVDKIRDMVSDIDIVEAIKSFIGVYKQLPPMYSAIKINGKKLYELAREGKVVERSLREVEIKNISIEKIEFPRVYFEVTCSKGTYIRSLCRDIGSRLKCPSCMEELSRTRVSQFDISESITLDKVRELVESGEIDNYVLPVDEALNKYQRVTVKEEFTKLVHNGNGIFANMLSSHITIKGNEMVRVYDVYNNFIGLYQSDEKPDKLKLYKMFYEKNEG